MIERERELDRAVVLEVAERHSEKRDALSLDHRHCRGEQPSRGGEDRPGLSRRLRQSVRSSRSREVAEAQPKRDRAAGPPGCPQPAGEPVDESDEDGVEGDP